MLKNFRANRVSNIQMLTETNEGQHFSTDENQLLIREEYEKFLHVNIQITLNSFIYL